jgi:abortive phage resistance protein AbiGi (putative antitoxin)
MPRRISEVISRRTDLGTFLVHLTRGIDPKANLESMLRNQAIEARSPFGAAFRALIESGLTTNSQKCVCFTETPLEHGHLLLQEIEGRRLEFAPYGIALPKKVGRQRGINPVWYVDITPGHDWLMNPINNLVQGAISERGFDGSPIERIAPFVEQMGTRNEGDPSDYRKEFWWEREWRHRGDLLLPNRLIVLCPEEEIEHFREIVDGDEWSPKAAYIDPRWGLEQIIARLAGFPASATDIL